VADRLSTALRGPAILIETLRTRLDQGPRFLHSLASLGRVLLRRGLFNRIRGLAN
jgi:hypothetical protein